MFYPVDCVVILCEACLMLYNSPPHYKSCVKTAKNGPPEPHVLAPSTAPHYVELITDGIIVNNYCSPFHQNVQIMKI